ncbi:hypothetical protein SKAU_G00307510 [Synaphobranchus kaupii]|uniref:Uncharacterized protein n=1 Tax=Synaphobranchus kaupii TaxID=118154 RepID=A0A9Q1IKX1_SYNKA|nr:hypothetical protein SKAU_G00307510 [Synaphobranchus kaupii]
MPGGLRNGLPLEKRRGGMEHDASTAQTPPRSTQRRCVDRNAIIRSEQHLAMLLIQTLDGLSAEYYSPAPLLRDPLRAKLVRLRATGSRLRCSFCSPSSEAPGA